MAFLGSAVSRGRTEIADLFPEEVVTVEADPRVVTGLLHPAEEDLLHGAVLARRCEITAGRLCAREALARLGIVGFPLLRRADRAPLWPPGIVGSISHTRDYCGVALAREGAIRAIGLDVEPLEGLETNLWHLVLTASEQRALKRHPPERQLLVAKVLFSAKESTYKCQYTLRGSWLEFQDVEVTLGPDPDAFEPEGGRFTARLPDGTTLAGAFRAACARVFTSAVVHG